MWLRQLTTYLLERRWQTLLIVFVISIVPLVGNLGIGILIAALITLSKSFIEGAVLTLAATVPCIISLFFPQPSSLVFLLILTIVCNLLTWVFAGLLRRQMSFNELFQLAALIGVLTVSLVHLIYPNIADWWGNVLNTYYSEALTANKQSNIFNQTISGEDLNRTIDHFKQFATGTVVMLVLLFAMSTVIVARWWQLFVFRFAKLKDELHFIRLDQLTGFLFIISMVFVLLGNQVVLDMMPIINVLFFAAGLSLVHYFFRQVKSNALFWLIFFYVILFITIAVSGYALVMLAFGDIWLDFRKRFKTV